MVANPKIVIELNRVTQQLTVNSEIEDFSMFLGMLEMAKVVMLEQRLKAGDSKIAVAVPGLPLRQ